MLLGWPTGWRSLRARSTRQAGRRMGWQSLAAIRCDGQTSGSPAPAVLPRPREGAAQGTMAVQHPSMQANPAGHTAAAPSPQTATHVPTDDPPPVPLGSPSSPPRPLSPRSCAPQPPAPPSGSASGPAEESQPVRDRDGKHRLASPGHTRGFEVEARGLEIGQRRAVRDRQGRPRGRRRRWWGRSTGRRTIRGHAGGAGGRRLGGGPCPRGVAPCADGHREHPAKSAPASVARTRT